jgi:hypothetical protein
MNADFAGPSRTGLSSPLSVVRLHCPFVIPMTQLAASEQEIANFPIIARPIYLWACLSFR